MGRPKQPDDVFEVEKIVDKRETSKVSVLCVCFGSVCGSSLV